jgi:hypothetical protein
MNLTLSEINRLVTDGMKPEDFVALDIEIAANVAGARETDFKGNRIVLVPMQLAIPRQMFKGTGAVMDKQGRVPNPLAGVCPLIEGRMLVPKSAMDPTVLAAMTGEMEQPPLPVLRPVEDPSS